MQIDTRHWQAWAVQQGTNERMHETAPTKEELDVKLFGRAYPAIRATVQYGRIGEAA